MSVPRFKTASLERLRSYANSLMFDQCRVLHMGKPVTDPETGLVEPAV